MMNELLIVAAVFVFFGLPSVMVVCACIAGTRSDNEPKSITPRRLHNTHPYRMSRQVSSSVPHE